MKTIARVYGLGVVTGMILVVLLALAAGADAITQFGMRYHAVEDGFELAMRHWQWEATPAMAEAPVQTPEPKVAKAPEQKAAKLRTVRR